VPDQDEGGDQFEHELFLLVNRWVKESDLSLRTVIGILEVMKANVFESMRKENGGE
jgi:hypothetical protein